ncbi:MAG: hypothetical protein BAJALOKI3v1_50050 [Promethearchaeota archaeon]|nr:MAG: hypothetical protein BAJALOKI3v1_50050 [Candidatus Lokiarchaeota archaeon]
MPVLLDDKQQKLILDNFNNIKSEILSDNKFNKIRDHVKIDDVMSYVVNAAQTFDKEKSENFVKYAKRICIYRTIDNIRKTMERKRSIIDKYNKKVNQADALVKDGKLFEANQIKPRDVVNQDINQFNPSVRDKNFGLVEWEDSKSFLLKEAKKQLNDIEFKILVEHYLPKADGKEYKTLTKISEEVELSLTYISYISKSDKIKRLIRKIIK